MDKIELFLSFDIGSGYGYGYGGGSGDGSGDGYGYGDGKGDGSGDGYGGGEGDGSGFGGGYGGGDGYGGGGGYGGGYGGGSGDGYGDGYGYGGGSGDGEGIPDKINNMQIYYVDDVPTIVTHVVGNIAKGYIVGEDLSLKPCYIAKSGNCFAHGKTKEQAIADVNAKAFSNLDVDEKINEFLKTFKLDEKYKGKDFYKWHNLLTGSCQMGRESFVRDNNLSLDDDYTVRGFIDICKNAYGSEIIKQLENKIKGEK